MMAFAGTRWPLARRFPQRRRCCRTGEPVPGSTDVVPRDHRRAMHRGLRNASGYSLIPARRRHFPMPRHPRLAVVVALAALAGFSPPTHADRYDTPIVSVSEVSRNSIRLEITAGATGLPAGFGVDWMTRASFLIEGWNPDGSMYYCNFTGMPTYNTWPGSLGYALGPFQTGWIEVGDLFDETGVLTDYNIELNPAVDYVFRAYGLGDANGEASYYTSTRIGTTLAESSCIFT